MEKRRSDLASYQFFATLLAWVVGTWLQLLQASLSDVYFYVAYLAVAGVFIAYIAINGIAKNALNERKNFQSIIPISIPICMLIASGCMAFGVTGLRAVAYASHQLQPAYEGRDIEVVGVVSAMPHINEMGTRFQLDVESAKLLTTHRASSKQTSVLVLPSKISLSWYGGVFGIDGNGG